MTAPNPAPIIPAIEADNAIDVVKLGSARLKTYIKYPGIEAGDGDVIILQWRGCRADGGVKDELNNQVTVDTSLLEPDGMPAEIQNDSVVDLDQGWAFYSYSVKPFGAPAPGEESLRIFFYVGKRPRARPALPVLQVKETHDLHLDLSNAPAELGARVVPYEAMADGDIVTLHCRRFQSDGQEYLPALAYPTQVTKADLGKPLSLFLNKSDLRRVDGGWIVLSYGIQYVNTPSEKTISAAQTIQLVAPTSATLPALTIVGHTSGTPINPADFPQGLALRIAAYPGISVGDEVLCDVHSDADEVEPLTLKARVDVSILDKGSIEFLVPPQWVKASNGYPINLRYQFAWIGAAMSSTPYPATIREALRLPWVIVEGAVPGDEPVEGEGEIEAASHITSGVNIKVDEKASYGPNDTIEMVWEGFGTTGGHIVTAPTTPGGRTFNIAAQYIPANMGKSVRVYYNVTPQGEVSPEKSEVYIVRVMPVPKSQYRAIQSTQAQTSNGRISIGKVPAQGEKFSFPTGWVFIREGQRLNALLVGKNASGQELTYPIFDNHEITKPQADTKVVETFVSATELRKFQLGSVTVKVTIAYEPGAETNLNDARFTLEA